MLRQKTILRCGAIILALVLVGTWAGSWGSVANAAKIGVKIGEAIPSKLMAKDAGGKSRDFQNLVGTRGAVLIFYRSASW
jgi:hypothetical protein